jgi:hypothetical protein
MKFTLTRPCDQCPFRTDIGTYLTSTRAEEICDSLLNEQTSFPCHKTIHYDVAGVGHLLDGTQHCAGAMIMLEKMEAPHQLLRIMYRIRAYDPTLLHMDSPVYESDEAMIHRHRTAECRRARA